MVKSSLEKYRGIHPGLILEHELKKRGILKNQFALAVDEHRQNIHAITKGRRKLPVELAFKIDKELGLSEGTMLLLQTYFEIEDYQRRHKAPFEAIEQGKLRKGLFWDTDINRIDWVKNANAIIRRVYERGNEEEKSFIARYYGHNAVKKVLDLEGIDN